MKILGIIPARYASTRFPGKPLVSVLGKPMIQRTWEQSRQCSALFDLVVATDDVRIADCVRGFGGQVVMTRSDHPTGTDRILEVMAARTDADAAINIQGDEPFIEPGQIADLCALLGQTQEARIGTLVRRLTDLRELANPNVVKVVRGAQGQALYFSRSQVPYVRDVAGTEAWAAAHGFWKHVGIYAYTRAALDRIATLPQGVLELAESLEQLRWLEAGIPVMTAETAAETHAIDTPEDLHRIETLFSNPKL